MKRWGLSVARWVFAAFFALVAGLRLTFTETAHWANPRADAFYSALRETHFLNPLLDISLLIGSALLLCRRTAPLGIVVFAPMILVFFGFHVLLNDSWLVGTAELAYLLCLAWAYRRAFVPLWNYQ